MANFTPKTPKSQKQEKTPYTVYYPHSQAYESKINKSENYLQLASIDPATKNYALRIERWYDNGRVVPIVFDKVSFSKDLETKETSVNVVCNELMSFLEKYEKYFLDCHYVIVERQLPQNYKSTRVAQHTINYFMLRLKDGLNKAVIVELNPQMKGKMLGASSGLNNTQLKGWSILVARKVLLKREDRHSLEVMDHFPKKQDDLADTVTQAIAFLILIGYCKAGKDEFVI